MTQEEILSGNALIAEFMGVKPVDSWYDGYELYKAGLPFNYGIDGNGTHDLKFNTSWDWLKIIIDEIGTYCLAYPDLTEGVRNLSIFVDILPAWRAVVKFIQQYNQNK